MEQTTITKEQFERAIEDAFKSGEEWGVCYSTWFTPTEADTREKIDLAKKAVAKDEVFKPFYLKSKCCNDTVHFYRGENVGYPKCYGCMKQCDIIEPKSRSESFQYEIERQIMALDYYVEDKKESRHNFEKMKLLRELRGVWEKVYFS